MKDYDSSDSFCFIPSKSEPSQLALKEENNTLRSELDGMKMRLENAERMLKLRQEQDQQLRENIAVARREVLHTLMGGKFQRTHYLDCRRTEQWVLPCMQHNEPASLHSTSQVSMLTSSPHRLPWFLSVRTETEKRSFLAKLKNWKRNSAACA